MSLRDNPWTNAITQANKYYSKWANTFKVDTLRDYYRGFQWRAKSSYTSTNYEPYTLNLINSTIQMKLAQLIFQKPEVVCSPRPNADSWDMQSAVMSAGIKQDTLNTVIKNPNVNFTKHIKRAARDSFLAYGLIEVGYASDWRNPQKLDPFTTSDKTGEEGLDIKKEKVLDSNDLPHSEYPYIRRIKPSRFRVSISDAEDLNDHDWCGYYDYYYTKTLQKTPGIKWTKPGNADSDSMFAADFTGFVGDNQDSISSEILKEYLQSNKVSKVWRIWDMQGKRELLVRDVDGAELWEEPRERLNLIDIRWDEEEEGFYPIPPVFQWMSAQNEINEAREQTRSYRRRFTRKFQYQEDMIEPEEVEKFTAGPDGVLISVKQKDAITAIDNPEIGPTSENALIVAKDDFNVLSGTSAEARGQDADRETATQAKIIDQRAMIRESAAQLDFSNFVTLVARELLLTLQEKMAIGMWVKYSSDPTYIQPQQHDQPVNILQNNPIYKYIKSQDINDGYDVDIDIDLSNSTPASQAASQTSFLNFLSVLQNYPMVAMSPYTIQEAAYRCGYRNQRVIQQLQQTAILSMVAKAQQLKEQQTGQTGINPQNAAATQLSQTATPSAQQTGDQINQQVQ